MEIGIEKSYCLWKYIAGNLLFYGNRIIWSIKSYG